MNLSLRITISYHPEVYNMICNQLTGSKRLKNSKMELNFNSKKLGTEPYVLSALEPLTTNVRRVSSALNGALPRQAAVELRLLYLVFYS